jgi:hypothetical protein
MASNRGSGRLLADITVSALAANTSIVSPTTGSLTIGQSTVGLTPNSVQQTAPGSGIVWDALLVRVHPGVWAAGSTPPDLAMWAVIDGISYQSWFYVDISATGLMFPRRENTIGQKVVKLGASLLRVGMEAAQARLRNPGRAVGFPHNMPLRYTGWKITQSLQLGFFSEAGFDASAYVVPPRVQILGDVYDAALLASLAAQVQWSPAISVTSPRRIRQGLPPFETEAPVPNFTVSGWRGLPGGSHQGRVQIQRSFRFAVNALSVSGGIYPLTALQSVGGSVQNVAQNQDLGWDFRTLDSAFILKEFGRRPGPGAGYWGLTWGNNEIEPLDTTLGQPLSYGDNPIPFGVVQPTLSDANRYYALPAWHAWEPTHEGDEVIYKETAAPFIAPQSGASILAGTDTTAYGGVLITQVQGS